MIIKKLISQIKLIPLIAFLATAFLHKSPSTLLAAEKVSFKTHKETALFTPNPMELSKLPRGETYQINHEDFSLQFFFNDKDIFGIIRKRNKSRAIHFRWCFFRTCEESQHDYKKVIAEASNPPFVDGFFSIPYPTYLPYSFQGVEFSSSH